MTFRFRDRHQAGRLLAAQLAGYADRTDVLVLALGRGGVPVAFEVARGPDARSTAAPTVRKSKEWPAFKIASSACSEKV